MIPKAKTIPTLEEINQCKQAIDSYLRTIEEHPERREGAYPYYLFHEPGEAIYGTIIMFHGFSAKPHQMWRLADYLFKNGFNVYQVTLAGHAFIHPEINWPQIELKPEYAEPIREKIQTDPVLSQLVNNLGNQKTLPITAIIKRIFKFNIFSLIDIAKAIESQKDPDFERYFISSHMNFLEDAQERLNELATMPGSIYTVGLSVGGATALALAAAQPQRVKKVVAYAPLLEVYGRENELKINLLGPLDLKDTGWDPNLQFPLACFTAANRFGGYVKTSENLKILANIPTFLVLTENEDAANLETNQKFFQQIGGEAKRHHSYLYDASDLVPHPMVDPTEVSQGLSNHFWQSMYQETFRFLTTGEIVAGNMDKFEQANDLPFVPTIKNQ